MKIVNIFCTFVLKWFEHGAFSVECCLVVHFFSEKSKKISALSTPDDI